MNLSNTARYAIRVISYMAYNKKELYTASELVEALQISDKYLKRILTTLSQHHIIRSIQGRHGGFAITGRPEDITIYDIVAAIEVIDKYYGCVLGFEVCSDEHPCALHKKWAPIRDELVQFLNNNTIADVMTTEFNKF
ncbi:MAG: Rrf2 family transcriptional regulator [Bacteroidales bacterium]|nr:Rrf2 family transcriptional regulator [Bacteroidales bacterium]